MFNIGLKKHISPHNKLSEFCKNFMEGIFPEFEAKIIQDNTYEFIYEKLLENCQLDIRIELKRDLNVEKDNKVTNIGFLAKIFVYCTVHNKYHKDSFYYATEPSNLSSSLFLKYLNNSNCFKEFHYYSSLMSKWNILVDSYPVFDKFHSSRDKIHKIISPYNLEFKYKKISIIPALIKYDVPNNKYIKRYDFLLIISYNTLDFIDEEFKYSSYLTPVKLKLIFKNREIIRPITNKRPEFDDDDFNKNMYIIQSTENLEEGLFKDIYTGEVKDMVLQYSIESDSFEKHLERNEISRISDLWEIFQELMGNSEQYKDLNGMYKIET